MTYNLYIQNVSGVDALPTPALWQIWLQTTLQGYKHDAEITLRLVDITESANLNWRSRKKSGPTNVLTFPFTEMPGISDNTLIGDIVICILLAEQEAKEKNMDTTAYLAYLFIHGLLHLLGYDHQNRSDAQRMETRETEILQHLGYGNPYAES